MHITSGAVIRMTLGIFIFSLNFSVSQKLIFLKCKLKIQLIFFNTAAVQLAYSVLFLLYFYISDQLTLYVTGGSFCGQPAC